MTSTRAAAATTYAAKLYAPARSNTFAGSPKMPAPMMELITSATRSQRLRPRTKPTGACSISDDLFFETFYAAIRLECCARLRSCCPVQLCAATLVTAQPFVKHPDAACPVWNVQQFAALAAAR